MRLLDALIGGVSRNWTAMPWEPLTVDLDRVTICGVGEDAPIECLSHFGRADNRDLARRGILTYYNRGLCLTTSDGRLTGCEIFFDDSQYTPFTGQVVSRGRTLPFSSQTTPADVVRDLGSPGAQYEEPLGPSYLYAANRTRITFIFNVERRLVSVDLM